MLRMALTILQLFAAIAIIALVLLQRGKGADAGAGFGAGASGTVFGARGARTALSRATAIFAAIFMVNSLLLAYIGTREAVETPKTILDEAATTAPSVPAPSGPAPGSQVPAPAPAAPPAQAPQSGDSAPATGTPSPEPVQ
jgi:preprotein translocase subunit SecG